MLRPPIDGAATRAELAALASGLFSQEKRLLSIETPALPGNPLVVERVRGTEGVNTLGGFEIDCLSPGAHLDLAPLIGTEVTLSLTQADGSHRTWHGYVMEATDLASNDGPTRYHLVLQPWPCLLQHNSDSFIFQSDKNVLEIVAELFRDYEEANWRIEVTETLPRFVTKTQYQESDFDFLTRLLAEAGLSYHFEHGVPAQGRQAHHCLVITDRQAQRPDLGPIRFSRPVQGSSGLAALAGSLLARNEDTITAFAAHRQIQPNAVVVGSWNYQPLSGASAEESSVLPQGEVGPLETYTGSGEGLYANHAEASRAALLALQAHEQGLKTFDGDANVRALRPYAEFTLSDHPVYGTIGVTNALLHGQHARDDARFAVLAIEHEAANNLGSQAAKLLDAPDLEAGSYQNHFSAVLAAVPIVPAYERRPTARGLETAIVVGLDGEAITTDRDLRIKIQYSWQRGVRPLPGGLAHETRGDSKGNAPGNEQSGTWVRVSTLSAGANWGSALTPRIGAEVVVTFTEGDIDRPVVLCQLYSGQDTPPFAAGVDSGVNHSGSISGLHVPTLDQRDYGQWIIDDATGQCRMRLLCSYRMSELGLGHLIQQGPTTAQRGTWRGAGYELITMGWATLRAGQGVLISSTARPQHGHSVEGTQMDVTEAVDQLKTAQELGQQLSNVAQAAQAALLDAHQPGQSWEQTIKGLDPQQDGKYDGPVSGQDAKKAQPGSRELGEPTERFNKPYVVLDTPSSVAFVSPASTTMFAGQDLGFVAQGDVQVTAAHTYSSVSGQTTSWYTHTGGLQAKAANGPFSLRAHTDALDMVAEQDLQVTSTNDEITIVAKTRITLSAGSGKIVLDGQNIEFIAPGSFIVKGATHNWGGGAFAATIVPHLPNGLVTVPTTQAQYRQTYHDGEPVQGAAYTAKLADGTKRTGRLDAEGCAQLDDVPPGSIEFTVRSDVRPYQPSKLPAQRDNTMDEWVGSRA